MRRLEPMLSEQGQLQRKLLGDEPMTQQELSILAHLCEAVEMDSDDGIFTEDEASTLDPEQCDDEDVDVASKRVEDHVPADLSQQDVSFSLPFPHNF